MRVAVTLGLLLGAACGRTGAYRLPFMQPPAHLGAVELPAFRDTARVGAIPAPSLLYATVRRPNPAGHVLAYGDDRATAVRVGRAAITFSNASVTWDEARRIALLKNGTDRYPLRVAEVREFGTIDRTERLLLEDSVTHQGDSIPRVQFSDELRRRLASRTVKDVFLYVHGYRVNFDNPLLVAAELWHFLGYEGVFIPFAWPSHVGRLDYLTDTENARYAAPMLRDFLEYLASHPEVARIHIVGYSAGTRLVAATLHQLALGTRHLSNAEVLARTKLGNVALLASDVDRGIFEGYVTDGLLRVQRRLTLYESPYDKALGLSRFAFGRRRIGQLDLDRFHPTAAARLRGDSSLTLVSVARALGADRGNGHSYFRDSPWVSADILTLLRYDFSPAARGLELRPDAPVWRFPDDYVERLRATLARAGVGQDSDR